MPVLSITTDVVAYGSAEATTGGFGTGGEEGGVDDWEDAPAEGTSSGSGGGSSRRNKRRGRRQSAAST